MYTIGAGPILHPQHQSYRMLQAICYLPIPRDDFPVATRFRACISQLRGLRLARETRQEDGDLRVLLQIP